MDIEFDIVACQRIMAERGITQTRLADEAGIPRSQLNRYLQGKSAPALDRVMEIAKGLDVPVERLIRDKTTPSAADAKLEVIIEILESLPRESRQRILLNVIKDYIR